MKKTWRYRLLCFLHAIGLTNLSDDQMERLKQKYDR